MQKNAIKKIWLNGKILPREKALVSVLDRGFMYGDGVYEAVRIYDGRVFRAQDHWRRLRRSLKSVSIKNIWNDEELTQICLSVAQVNNLKESLVRLTISRGIGDPGYDPSTAQSPTVMAFALAIRPDLPKLWEGGVEAALVQLRRNPIVSLSPLIKHTNSLNGILAKIESLKTRAYEGIFLNTQGFLAEGTISNVFFIDAQGVLKTPSLDCGVLEGVTRGVVLECARELKIKVVQGNFLPQELQKAKEIFLTSTTMEVMPVIKLNGKKISNGNAGVLTKMLQQSFKNKIQKELF